MAEQTRKSFNPMAVSAISDSEEMTRTEYEEVVKSLARQWPTQTKRNMNSTQTKQVSDAVSASTSTNRQTTSTGFKRPIGQDNIDEKRLKTGGPQRFSGRNMQIEDYCTGQLDRFSARVNPIRTGIAFHELPKTRRENLEILHLALPDAEAERRCVNNSIGIHMNNLCSFLERPLDTKSFLESAQRVEESIVNLNNLVERNLTAIDHLNEKMKKMFHAFRGGFEREIRVSEDLMKDTDQTLRDFKNIKQNMTGTKYHSVSGWYQEEGGFKEPSNLSKANSSSGVATRKPNVQSGNEESDLPEGFTREELDEFLAEYDQVAKVKEVKKVSRSERVNLSFHEKELKSYEKAYGEKTTTPTQFKYEEVDALPETSSQVLVLGGDVKERFPNFVGKDYSDIKVKTRSQTRRNNARAAAHQLQKLAEKQAAPRAAVVVNDGEVFTLEKGEQEEEIVKCLLTVEDLNFATYRATKKLRKLFQKSKRAMQKEEMRKHNTGPAQGFFGVDHNITLKKMEEYVKGVTIKHNHAFEVPDELRRMLESLKKDIDWMAVIRDLVFGVIHAYEASFSWCSIVTNITQFALTHGIVKPVQELVEWLQSKFSGLLERTANTQAGTTALWTVLGGIPIVLLGILLCGGMPQTKSIETFYGRYAKLGACINSTEKMMSMGPACGNLVRDFFHFCTHGYWPVEENAMRPFEDFCEKVREMYTAGFEAKLQKSDALKMEIEKLHKEALDLLKMRDQLKIPAQNMNLFNHSFVVVKKLRELASVGGVGNHKPRTGALVYHFFGDTGVGKSALTSFVNAELLAHLGYTEPEDLGNKVFFRDATNERFDGWSNDVVGMVYDDFGMIRDTAGNPNREGAEIIRAANEAVWPLDMANLHDKGVSFFNCAYVLLTSNIGEFRWESMTNNEAVERRIDERFEVKVHKEYSRKVKVGDKEVTMLDTVKMENLCTRNGPGEMLKAWYFIDKHNDDKQLTYEEVVEILKRRLDVHKTRDAMRKEFLYDYQRLLKEKKTNVQGLFDFEVKPRMKEEITDEIGKKIFRDTWSGWTEVNLNSLRTVMIGDEGDDDDFVYERPAKQTKYPPGSLDKRESVWIHTKDKVSFVGSFSRAFKSQLWAIPNEHTVEDYYVHYGGPHFQEASTKENSEFDASFRAWLLRNTTNRKVAQWGVLSTSCALVIGLGLAYLTYKLASWLGEKMQNVLRPLKEWVEDKVLPDEMMVIPWETIANAKDGEDLNAKAVKMTRDVYLGRVKAESFQDNTKARPAKGKVESAQDKTKGAKPKNVEADEVVTKGDRKLFRKGRFAYYVHEDITYAVCRNHLEDPTGVEECTQCLVVSGVKFAGQMSVDQNGSEIVRMLRKNMMRVSVSSNGQRWSSVGNAFFIKGRVAVINKHIRKFGKDKIWSFKNDTMKFMVAYSELNFGEEHPERDISIFEAPRSMPTFRDMTGNIVTKGDINTFSSVKGVCLAGYTSDGIFRQADSSNAMFSEDCFIQIDTDGSEAKLRSHYRYAINTESGDCGMVAVIMNKALNRKICGIHAAGNKGVYTGVAAAFTYDYILDHLPQNMKPESFMGNDVPVVIGQADPTEEEIGLVKECEMIARLPQMYNPTKTNIRPSPLHGMFPVKTAPAPLKPFKVDGQTIDPMEIAREKVFTPNLQVHEGLLKKCAEAYEIKLLSNVDEADQQVLTMEEAIVGKGEFYEPIKRNTSPGYGWKAKGKGKQPWLGTDTYITDHPEVVAAVNEKLARAKEGKRTGTIWTDTLKDERRTHEKVRAGRTRLFAASEMSYVILFRMYFMGFAAHMMKNKIAVESCVGLNPFSMDWTRIAKKLLAKGRNIVAGDFSNYDGTLNGSILWACLDTINKYYDDGPENALIRRSLWMDIVYSVHAGEFKGKTMLYMWTHSQPSGCPITAILNSLYHSIVARYVFMLIAAERKPEMAVLSNFDKYVAHVNYGDDDLYSISSEIVPWFNQTTMADMFPVVGMKYTDEGKTGEMVAFRKLEDVAFLKRKFRLDEERGGYQCPLSLDTITEMAMWIKNDVDVEELTSETVEEAVSELARHDKETFDSIVPVFQKEVKEKLENPPYLMAQEDYQRLDILRHIVKVAEIPIEQLGKKERAILEEQLAKLKQRLN